MSDPKTTYMLTPVCEYLGVAFCERNGDVPKTYQGTEYTTDGFTYIIRREGHTEEGLACHILDTEEEARDMVASMSEEQRAECMSYREVFTKVLGRSREEAEERYKRQPYGWEWSDEEGQFVRAEKGRVESGKTRINPREA